MRTHCETHEDLVDRIWHDLDRQVDRTRVAQTAREIAAALADATVPTFVPLFVRRLSYESLSAHAARQSAGGAAAAVDGSASGRNAP